MSENLNKNLETYEIEAELGKSDLTIDYLAHRISDNLPVVIKAVAPQFTFDSYFVLRFKDAVTRATELKHPNILGTYEVGERDDILYIVRELVEADTLADYLDAHGPLPVERVVTLIRQIALALDYAHSKAIRHGNLTDTSIFIKDDHIWVTDFGLTQAMEGTSLVKKGFAVGNPVYLSPERVRGESSSRTADLYALGILCYQMITGKPPFSGEPTAVLHAQVYEALEPPHVVNPKVRPAVSEVILRMLSKGLELRHSTGAEFVNALQVAAEGSAPIHPVTKQDNTVPQLVVPIWKRFAFWAFLLTPVLGCALAGGFWIINQWVSTPQSTPDPDVLLQNAPTPVPTFVITTPTFTEIAQSGVADVSEPILTPVDSPTATSLPVLGEPVIATHSPFSNLVLAHDITDDYQPEQPASTFPPTEDPIYLFFDYEAIQPGSSWGLVWKWDDIVLEESQEVWPEDYSSAGTAWVYFAPPFGFQPGPYSISLQVNGNVVAAVDFVVQ